MTKPTIYTASPDGAPLSLSYDETTDALIHGTLIEELGLMRLGSNYTFLVVVEHDERRFLAIYKPRDGERPLWDFADGTLCKREVAACVMSEALGWYLVPPTVLRMGERGEGSVQVFIQHDPKRHYFTFDERHAEQLKQLALFDAIANNADRKGGHCLLDETGRVWGIDQGLCFNHAPKLRTVIWDFAGQPIADDLLEDLRRWYEATADPHNAPAQALARLLDASEMLALQRRLGKLIKSGCYPMPAPHGANRPYPPI